MLKSEIGTIRQKGLSFKLREQAFEKDAIPPQAAEAKSWIKKYTYKDNLGIKKKDWAHSSMDIDQKIQTGTIEFLKSDKPNKVWPGVETKQYYGGWDISVQKVKTQRNYKNIQEITKNAQEWSKQSRNAYLTQYKTPFQQQTELIQTQKLIKTHQLEKIWNQMKEELFLYSPDSSTNKIATGVFKKVQQKGQLKKLIDFENSSQPQEIQSPIFSRSSTPLFKSELPRLKVSLSPDASNKYKLKHNGDWKRCSVFQKNVWTCCLSENQNSVGCMKISKDKRWGLGSIN